MRTSAYDLAFKLSGAASYCRDHAAELARLQDLTTEFSLVEQVDYAIRYAMAAVTITPAVDYDPAADKAAQVPVRTGPGQQRAACQRAIP